MPKPVAGRIHDPAAVERRTISFASVQLSFDRGYDASLREVYGLPDVAALERHWKSKTDLPQAVAIGQTGRGRTLADASLAADSAN